MYLTHLGIRIQRGSFHIYLRKWFFWTPKDCCSLLVGAKKTFSSTLNVMILQMVKNESVRFGRHIDIEVSYKILQLEIPKLVLILHYLACFQKGLFGGNFKQKHSWSFRGEVVLYNGFLQIVNFRNTLGPSGLKRILKFLYSPIQEHNILQGQASRPFSTVKKSIPQHPRSMPCWILIHFKLKFCWKKLFALIVTSIV
jgi:hypothetical protein